MFLSADLVVKTVMVGLAFASVVTWTVWLAKSLELLAATRRLRRGLGALERARSLAKAAHLLDVARGGRAKAETGTLVDGAMAELDLSAGLGAEGIRERVASRFRRPLAGA